MYVTASDIQTELHPHAVEHNCKTYWLSQAVSTHAFHNYFYQA